MRKVATKVCKLQLFSQLYAPIKTGVRNGLAAQTKKSDFFIRFFGSLRISLRHPENQTRRKNRPWPAGYSAEVWGRTGAESVPQDLSSCHKNPDGQLGGAPGVFFPRDRDTSVDVFANRSARKALDTMKTKHGGRTAHGQQASAEVWGRGVP